MKLVKLLVENYKCIEHSNEVRTDQVTCLVGKNEAGKSAMLEALYKLNPVEGDKDKFTEEDFPRRHLTTYRARQDVDPSNVLTTTWTLDDADVAHVESAFGSGVITDRTVVITKDYDNELHWTIHLDEPKIVQHVLTSASLTDEQRAAFEKATSIKQLAKMLNEAPPPTPAEGQPAPQDTAKNLLAVLQARFRDCLGTVGVRDHLQKRLPTFLYFTEYQRLFGRVAINDLVKRQQNKTLEFGHRIFLALLDLANSSAEDFNKIGRSEQLIMELEAIKIHLTDQIFAYWSQNDHLEVEFRYDMGRPQDAPPFNDGYVFNTRILNRRHRATVNFDERSTGFIWFFSFLVWFSQVKKNYGENIVILLDEPGLSLHGRAQGDLLRYINNELRPSHQVIYTTHSPFMLDMENIFSVRTVEDVVRKETVDGRTTERVLGTKLGERILSRDRDTLLPLEGILGFDVARTMFIGPNVLVVEGPTELGYINWFSRQLAARGKTALDLRWAVCPAEGASKITSFVTLFAGRGLRIAVLLDDHEGQKKMVDDLERSNLLVDRHLLRTTAYAGQDEADIEDLVGRPMFRYLVNGCLQLTAPYEFPETKPQDAPKRLVKEVEDFNRRLPPAVPKFDHYIPVSFLMDISREAVVNIPGLDDALTRFERLFQDLNDLLVPNSKS